MQRPAVVLISALFTTTPLALAGASPALAQTGTKKAPALNMSQKPDPKIGTFMTVREAHEQALAKKIVLIDIRTPAEWRESGIPASATPLTMHQSAARFFGGLNQLTLFDKSRPIALICATGSRTTFLQKLLRQQGYSNVINVAEGLFGSKYGPGWLQAGLPVKPYGGARANTVGPAKPAPAR